MGRILSVDVVTTPDVSTRRQLWATSESEVNIIGPVECGLTAMPTDYAARVARATPSKHVFCEGHVNNGGSRDIVP